MLDGATRFLVHWELREQMSTAEFETVVHPARRPPKAESRSTSAMASSRQVPTRHDGRNDFPARVLVGSPVPLRVLDQPREALSI